MFERLSERVREQVRAMVDATAARIAATYDAVPGVRAFIDGERVVVEGRGLARRRIEDPRLRWGWR